MPSLCGFNLLFCEWSHPHHWVMSSSYFCWTVPLTLVHWIQKKAPPPSQKPAEGSAPALDWHLLFPRAKHALSLSSSQVLMPACVSAVVLVSGQAIHVAFSSTFGFFASFPNLILLFLLLSASPLHCPLQNIFYPTKPKWNPISLLSQI